MRKLQHLTNAQTPFQAIRSVWLAGIEAFEQKSSLAELEKTTGRLQKELLTASQLAHDYETKIHNAIRQSEEYRKQNQELERAYRALRRENQWLKEEIFELKGKPIK